MSSFLDSEKFFGFRKDGDVVCFDILKAPHIMALEKLVYDVKILYDLEGKDTEKLEDLAREVLGNSRVADYSACLEKKRIHQKTYKTTKINWNQFSLETLLPKDLIHKLAQERNSIIRELFEKSKEKEFYLKFYPVIKCLWNMQGRPLYIDLESIKDDLSHHSNLIRSSVRYGELYLKFNPVGAKTGRLSFEKGTPNLYILPKELRKCIVAPPDHNIVQLDFKSFQPRLAIFCTDDTEFKNKFSDIEDIYSVFPGDREENKISFISWMFSKRKHEMFDVEASPIIQLRRNLHFEAKRNGRLATKFGRNLHHSDEEENVVFQNYITANEVDAILTLMIKIDESLNGKRSRIIFPFHDSIVLYVHKDEMFLISKIKDLMENEHRLLFGSKFPVSVKCGKNFEQMENWK